jgi:radical SAM superfamily enzyme YgiQ (UPF0313 family)
MEMTSAAATSRPRKTDGVARVVLLNPPVPAGRFTNRDLMGGMGIDDGFGLGSGTRFVAMLKNRGTRMPVIWLAYGASALAGGPVVVLDQAGLTPDDPAALDAVVRQRPDWVVAATSFGFLGAELKYLDEIHRRTGARRLLFGYAATFYAEEILARGMAEAVSSGDPEVAIRALASEPLLPGTPGLILRTDDGQIVKGAPGFVEALDDEPFPDWSGFPLDEYAYFPLLKQQPFLTLQSSRGCPYGCHFCPYPIAQGAPFRGRSPKNVVDEMQRNVERWGVRSILFRDPTFSMDTNRAKAICGEILDRGLKVDWGIETRLDRMDDEMIDLLARAGCRSAEFGIDPIEEHTRQSSKRKGIDPKVAAARISRMERAGIAAAGLFVIGIPGMTREEMDRTIAWIDTLDMSYVNYEVATPFPGTPLYTTAVSSGWTKPLTLDDLLLGDPKLSFNGVIDVQTMKELQDRALSRFYVRPRKVLKELFNGSLFGNLRFLAQSGLKFIASELRS